MKDNLNGKDLDQELSSPAQMQVREIVQALPEETVSLSWRSDLNARLHAEVARRRKLNLFGWIWKPAAGLALAGALALAFMIRPPAPGSPETRSDVEKALVNSYVDNTASWEVTGDGITVNEVKETANPKPVPIDFDQEDVGATL